MNANSAARRLDVTNLFLTVFGTRFLRFSFSTTAVSLALHLFILLFVIFFFLLLLLLLLLL